MLLALSFELRRLFTIQTTEDAKHYTGLPVLATIPELLTPSEARAIPRRQNTCVGGGNRVPRSSSYPDARICAAADSLV